MKSKKNFQQEIARRIILYTGMVYLAICAALLALFAWKLHQAMNQQVDYAFFKDTLLGILAAICACCAVGFVALYFIAKGVARQSIEPLKQALQRERSFTGYASHELRTPLAVLKGSLEVLIRKPRTHEEYGHKIQENIRVIDGMNTMVDNLLTLTRIESGKMMPAPVEINVKDMLTEICSTYADAIVANGLHLDLDGVPRAFTVRTDRYALLTILNNAVSNAVKYCDRSGHIRLRAGERGRQPVIEVENTGRGFPEEEAPLVFDQFYRSIGSGQQKKQGYGLGLAIVKRFADNIHASVSIESSSDGPTTLRIALPRNEQGHKPV